MSFNFRVSAASVIVNCGNAYMAAPRIKVLVRMLTDFTPSSETTPTTPMINTSIPTKASIMNYKIATDNYIYTMYKYLNYN